MRKVTHVFRRQSDRVAVKEKGHACFVESKRHRRQKRERSRIFQESKATEARKKRKVTHVSGKQSDGGVKKEKGHACFQKAKRQSRCKGERSRMLR